MATWRQELFGPGLDTYDPFDRRRSPIGPPLPPVTQAVAPPAPPLAPLPPIAQPIAQAVQPGPTRGEQAARLAQDIAYGRSDWERAGQAVLGSGQYEDASGLRRAGAVLGGVALGGIALASWIPGFNVFKPAQAARAARRFGEGFARGAESAGTLTGAVRTGYRDAAELERQRRAAVAAKKAADRPVTQASVAAEQGRVYDVTNFRNQSTPDFGELERLALRTNLQARTIQTVRVGKEALDPSHPLRNAQNLVDQMADAGLVNRMDLSTYSALDNPLIVQPAGRFLYTLGSNNPQIVQLGKINPSEPSRMFFVPEITPDFIDFHGSLDDLARGWSHADSVNPERFVEGILRRPGNAVLGEGANINVVSVFDNMDEAFSAAAARGRPYIQTPWDVIPVPDSYWPDRTVGQNILARYGSRYSPVSGKSKMPRRSRDKAGRLDWTRQGPVDLVPRGSRADLLARVVRDQGFDRLPALGNPDDIARLQSEGYLILYRGITSVNNPAQNIRGLIRGTPPTDNSRALKWANDLSRGEFYAGTGSHGAGLYFSPQFERATSYTEGYGAIVTAALPPGARIMGPGEFQQLARKVRSLMAGQTNYGEVAGTGILKGFTGTPMQLDMGRLIAMLGYDGYIPHSTVFGYARPEIVMFNRSILTLDQVPRQVWGGLRELS